MDRLKFDLQFIQEVFFQPITFDVFLLQLKYSLKGSQQDFLDSAEYFQKIFYSFVPICFHLLQAAFS